MPVGVSVKEVATDLQATASEAARHPRPTADDWSKLLEKAAVYATIPLAHYLSHPGPYHEEYELSDGDAQAIFAPLARIIARSKINQRWGHTVMQGGEYIDCVAALVGYGATIAPAIGAKIAGGTPPPPRNIGVQTRERNSTQPARPVTRSAEPTPNSDGGSDNGQSPRPRVVPSADWQPPAAAATWTPGDITESAVPD